MISAAPEPGDVIEDYEILEKVGGNMGLVFKARHRRIHKVVALKLLPIEWIGDEARQARFEREMRVMGKLEHPNLVTATDARRKDPWHLVVMEWIDGLDLLQLVKMRGPLPVSVACEAARQAALGLQYAHEHGLVHRDVKPSNLMLTRSGTIKVIDLGLARENDESTGQLTQPGDVMGTLGYCAPEQFTNATHVDTRADIYSLGCTLFHLLVGKAPYASRKSAPELMHAHMHETFPSLAQSRSDVPEALEKVLSRMTAKDPNARFSTPQEVVDALEPFARGADLKPLVPAKAQENLPQPGPAGKPAPTPYRQPEGSPPRKPKALWPRIAAAIALLFAAGVVLFAVNRTNRLPVVVLMDTTAEKGVYEEDDRKAGVSNTEAIRQLLRGLQLDDRLYSEQISPGWIGESRVLGLTPDLLVMHRSLFFHPMNAIMKLGYPPFETQEEMDRWQALYDIADDKLINLIGSVGTVHPHAKFLIYSRGTDKRWKDPNFRTNDWPQLIEARFPVLKGRITTMLIQGGTNGTFKMQVNADEMRRLVRVLLGLPE